LYTLIGLLKHYKANNDIPLFSHTFYAEKRNSKDCNYLWMQEFWIMLK
jgi:hypothetical protein